MAVRDLWTLKSGQPSKRHGRGLRWRVDVPGHPVEHYAHKGVAERRERALWNAPRTAAKAETVGDMVEVWKAGKAGLSDRGRAAAVYAAQVVTARWETVLLRDVAEDDVRTWIANLETDDGTPGSLSMRTKALQCIKGALDVAVRRKLLTENPAADVTVPQQKVREGRALTLAEVQLLTAAMDARYRAMKPGGEGVTQYGAMLWLMVTAGPRISETCALNVGSVDVKRRRVRVFGKGGKWRNLPVADEVLALLHLEGRSPSEPLFTTVREPDRISPSPWRRRWFAEAVKDAGLGDVRPHDLRHTAVTWAIHEGASIHDIQAMCGHARASITWDVYGHLLDGHLDDVAARVGALIKGVPGTVAAKKP